MIVVAIIGILASVAISSYQAYTVRADEVLYLTPYETDEGAVVWRCGNESAPAGLATMGTAGGGNAASYSASSISSQYLPSTCR